MIVCNTLANDLLEKSLQTIHLVSQPLIYYSFVFLVFVILVAVISYRLVYRTGFWGKQPIKRKYSILDRVRGEGVIDSEMPIWTKYCNEINVTTSDKLTETCLSRIAKLANNNMSLDNGLVKHASSDSLMAMFNGFQDPIYVSFYTKESNDYGCLTSRPVKIRLNRNEIQAYLFDYFHIYSDSRSTKDNIETSLL